MTPTKVFILTPRGNFCIATFTNVPHAYIMEQMTEVAQARGYPLEIQWPHTSKRTYISSKNRRVRDLQNKLKNLRDALSRTQTCYKGAVKRQSRKGLKKQIGQLKAEIRRVKRNLRKENRSAMDTLVEE